MQQKDNLTFELMTAETVHGVAELAKTCFTTPWSESIYRRELENPQAITFVCIYNHSVIGFINCGYVLDELTLNTLAVSADFRRQGIAHKLWELAVDMIQGVCSVCYLEVRESNLAARSLYESLGFSQNGYRPRYYQQPEEAAVLMSCELTNIQETAEESQ